MTSYRDSDSRDPAPPARCTATEPCANWTVQGPYPNGSYRTFLRRDDDVLPGPDFLSYEAAAAYCIAAGPEGAGRFKPPLTPFGPAVAPREIRDERGELVGRVEPASANEALRLEPLEDFLAQATRCPECREPIVEFPKGSGLHVIWSGVPHDAMLCAYYRDLKAIDPAEAEAELAAAGRRARAEARWGS